MLVQIIDNDDGRFPGHTLIEATDDQGRVLWRSWAESDIDPAVRLNPDQYPQVADRRTGRSGQVAYRVPTIAEYLRLNNLGRADYDAAPDDLPGVEQHRRLARAAVIAGAVTESAAAAAIERTVNDVRRGPPV